MRSASICVLLRKALAVPQWAQVTPLTCLRMHLPVNGCVVLRSALGPSWCLCWLPRALDRLSGSNGSISELEPAVRGQGCLALSSHANLGRMGSFRPRQAAARTCTPSCLWTWTGPWGWCTAATTAGAYRCRSLPHCCCCTVRHTLDTALLSCSCHTAQLCLTLLRCKDVEATRC